jgi:hypothetical protein
MKAFRFDMNAPAQGTGVKHQADLKRASGNMQTSGMEQDTGFARPRKAYAQIPVGKLGQRALTVHA